MPHLSFAAARGAPARERFPACLPERWGELLGEPAPNGKGDLGSQASDPLDKDERHRFRQPREGQDPGGRHPAFGCPPGETVNHSYSIARLFRRRHSGGT